MKKFLVIASIVLGSFQASAADWEKLLNWGDSFRAKYGNELKGKTTDGKPCMLSSYDQSWGENRQAYLSLGTSVDGSPYEPGNFTWIGTFVNPYDVSGDFTLNALEVTESYVHLNVTQDEVDASGVQNDLYIKLDGSGSVIEATGKSSHWLSSTCVF